jgi:hypothetical protein
LHVVCVDHHIAGSEIDVGGNDDDEVPLRHDLDQLAAETEAKNAGVRSAVVIHDR